MLVVFIRETSTIIYSNHKNFAKTLNFTSWQNNPLTFTIDKTKLNEVLLCRFNQRRMVKN